MKAVILCAGYATRLYPLTLDKPKALLPVSQRPIIDFIIDKMEKLPEVDEIYVVSNGKFYSHFKNWLDGRKISNKKIKIINDETYNNETRLGGLGDLQFAIKKEKINDDLLVVCGDNLFDSDLDEMVRIYEKFKKPVVATYDLKDFNEAKKMGIVIEKNGEIIGFEEKPKEPKGTLCSSGIYLFPKELIEEIEKYMKSEKPKDGPGYFVIHLLSFSKVCSFEIKGKWYDIGSLETYEKVRNLNI